MNIGCVTQHDYPTPQEIRVTRLASAVHQAGARFTVFCPPVQGKMPREEFRYGNVIRPGSNPPKTLMRLWFLPLPLNLIWAAWLYFQFKREHINCAAVRDLRLSLPTILAARLAGIPCVLDIGEHYPGMMKALGKQRAAHLITRNLTLISLLERVAVVLADETWVVAQENHGRLQSIVPAAALRVIPNFPDAGSVASQTKGAQQIEYSDKGLPTRLVFLGLIDNLRGLDLALDALRVLLATTPNVHLDIYGDGPHSSNLKNHASRLGVEYAVTFHGWVGEDQKSKLLAQADIALLLHKDCELTQFTIPNKIFDYMAAGLPVVVTPLSPLIKIIDESECGEVVSENPEEVAAVLENLIRNIQRRREMSQKGLRNAGRYNWQSQVGLVNSSIQALTARKR